MDLDASSLNTCSQSQHLNHQHDQEKSKLITGYVRHSFCCSSRLAQNCLTGVETSLENAWFWVELKRNELRCWMDGWFWILCPLQLVSTTSPQQQQQCIKHRSAIVSIFVLRWPKQTRKTLFMLLTCLRYCLLYFLYRYVFSWGWYCTDESFLPASVETLLVHVCQLIWPTSSLVLFVSLSLVWLELLILKSQLTQVPPQMLLWTLNCRNPPLISDVCV